MERFRPISYPNGVDESTLRQKKVYCTIPVNAEYRRETHRREGTILVDGVYNDTGCIVVAHWEQSTIKRFDVYAGAGSKSAVATINRWVARGEQKSKDSSAWAKTPAFNHTQWYQEKLERWEEERMEGFLGPVPDMREDEPVWPKIVVDWPEDLGGEINPRAAFGNTLQALDDIRKRDKVYITLLPNDKVEILGSDIINVEAAENHYKTMIKRIRTERNSLQQATNMILDEREGIDVVLVRAGNWWPKLCTDTVVPRLLPSPMMDQPGSFREDGLHDFQLIQIRDSIKCALEAVSHKKGSYDFVVRLSCVALDSRKIGEDQIGKKHSKDMFIKSINNKVELEPKKWLLDNVLGVQLYRRLVTAKNLLEPIKSADYWGTIPASLEQTRPSFRGTWIFRDPSSPLKQPPPPPRNIGTSAPLQQMPLSTALANNLSSMIVVQVDWTDDGEGSYDKTGKRFYRLDPGKAGAKVNMDVNLLELGESRAWSFALESMTPISQSTVPAFLTGFAHDVDMRPGYEVTSTQSFAEWDKGPSVHALLQGGRLDKVYSFGLQNTCYKAELSAMWYPNEPYPCWGLAVRHIEWATHLAELERLQTGHQASWDDAIATFFPEDGGSSTMLKDDDNFGVQKLKANDVLEEPQRKSSWEGIRVLTNILLQLSELVSSVTTAQGGVQI